MNYRKKPTVFCATFTIHLYFVLMSPSGNKWAQACCDSPKQQTTNRPRKHFWCLRLKEIWRTRAQWQQECPAPGCSFSHSHTQISHTTQHCSCGCAQMKYRWTAERRRRSAAGHFFVLGLFCEWTELSDFSLWSSRLLSDWRDSKSACQCFIS